MTTWPRPPALSGDADAATELESLDESTCWALLGEAPIGRIAVTAADGTILVLPVNFVCEAGTLVFRTAPGAALDHLGDGFVAGGHRRTLVRIDVERITGRVLRPAQQEWDTRGYL